MKTPQLVAFLLLYATYTIADDSKYSTILLPLGVKINVPQNWWVISGDMNTNLEAAAEAALNLSGIDMPTGKKVNLFRANSMPKTTYAGIAINASDAEISEEDIISLTQAELAELTPMMRETIGKSVNLGGASIVEFYPLEKRFVSGKTALYISYKRTGPQGNVVVKMTKLILGKKEIGINLSYRENEAAIWKPIIEYMESTILILK